MCLSQKSPFLILSTNFKARELARKLRAIFPSALNHCRSGIALATDGNARRPAERIDSRRGNKRTVSWNVALQEDRWFTHDGDG